ncbi:MAG: N-acetylneuraminate synthase family protein [Chloroflexi bacterium]|nr:N-acetylneuraminate synthase family protein [Chloroflexota bacterium]
MQRELKIGDRWVGDGHPTYVIAEIGINHNGDVESAKRLIDAALLAGVDAVKFQKRTPELCVPLEEREKMRDTPWGYISYIDYRNRVEFENDEYTQISEYCQERKIPWFSSVWDEPSAEFMEAFDPPCHKVPSAALTDHDLLIFLRSTGRPIILSTGMSTMDEIDQAVDLLVIENLVITHATSTYPCAPSELNLNMIKTLRARFACPIGYSGHEVGLAPSLAAVALGACMIERHITLDRAMWGSDQAASVEPHGFARLMKDIRVTEEAFGDGVKRVYESEQGALRKLRRVKGNVRGNSH